MMKENALGLSRQMNGFREFDLTRHQIKGSIASRTHIYTEDATMAQLDHVIRIYHVIHPTGEHLAGLKAPRWPDAYTLAASFPDPGLAPKETLELAFECT